MTEDDLRHSLLKVIHPYEGTAFMASHDRAVTCVHVCVSDDQPKDVPYALELEYLPPGRESPVRFGGVYLPGESDPIHDLAVIRVEPPGDVHLPVAALSLDDHPDAEVVILGFPTEQPASIRVPGAIFRHHRVGRVAFSGGVEHDVLHIDTRGDRGFWSRPLVRRAMSGGPIFNLQTGTVVAVALGVDPLGGPMTLLDSYGIQLQHLATCCDRFRGLRARHPRLPTTIAPVFTVTDRRVGSPTPPDTAGADVGSEHEGVRYVLIQPGVFAMGPPARSRPATVEAPFWISQSPISAAQFARVRSAQVRGSYPDHPKTHVSWRQAADYCAAVRGRLPTEIEWEYAARGGEVVADVPPQNGAGKIANYAGSGPTPPRVYPANGFGLYDMSGNVWEWCADRWEPSSHQRVVRGGSWREARARCTVWAREPRRPDKGWDDVGFRCVLPYDR